MSTVFRMGSQPISASSYGLLARVADIALVIVCAVTAAKLRFADVHLDSAIVAFSCAFTLAIFPAFGIYQSWRGRSMFSLVGRITLAWLIVQCGTVFVVFFLHNSDLISRLWWAYSVGLTVVAFIAIRLLCYRVLRSLRRAGMNLRMVAVVGRGAYTQRILDHLARSPESGFRVTATFEGNLATESVNAEISTPAAHFGGLSERIRDLSIDEIWLALPLSEEAVISKFVDEFRDDLVNIRLMPDVSSLAIFDGKLSSLIGFPAIDLAASPLPPQGLLGKAIFDRTFALLAILSLAPLMTAIAIAIKLTSKGPIFFTQRRKGAEGRIFRIFKFRTMRPNSDKPGIVIQATRNDSRVTPVGKFLRRTSLDELPQFINVLIGDMSVVGPRPHAIEHDEQYRKLVDQYMQRYRVKPGITGWAQVNGFRGETDRVEKMQKRVEHDLFYLKNWSFTLDMRIVLATFVKGIVHRNAY
ncbi:Undecaprenyl-phosphate glucose phosphotransferase [Paraburkholderia sp. BL6669N2]|uniref:undecaprenyl-phosphate glucose phosphotransferase n=1 Tax=Paraburkholderia sp. BL6669N2 TaxID=1938807 RepID=UPI000E26E234|nr:undecaprenyl-phosphate glucose phosphotransferase [Paraburkholderia sp. BL6669N2]REG45613.1 Undecaprenyl-phosphate glucose phosphotransferase [Paraburkholderia sp. BL6669N2]